MLASRQLFSFLIFVIEQLSASAFGRRPRAAEARPKGLAGPALAELGCCVANCLLAVLRRG
jgi:hypothetical protein